MEPKVPEFEILRLAAAVESNSSHPIARAIVKAAEAIGCAHGKVTFLLAVLHNSYSSFIFSFKLGSKFIAAVAICGLISDFAVTLSLRH